MPWPLSCDRACACQLVSGRVQPNATLKLHFPGRGSLGVLYVSPGDSAQTELPLVESTGHRSVAMVRVYTRRADAFADHAGEGLL